MAAPLHLQVLLRNRCWILPIRCPNMFPQNGLLDLFRFSGQTYGTPEIFFWSLNLGYLGFWSHFPKTVCPCRFIFAVCLALFDSTILLYEYQSHQVELFLYDYLHKTLNLFRINPFINHLNPELSRNSFKITFEKNKSFELCNFCF